MKELNSLTVHQQNFVLSGTIFSTGSNSNIWHAGKSFPMIPNIKGLAVAKAEIIQFEVYASKNLENAIFKLFETVKELRME